MSSPLRLSSQKMGPQAHFSNAEMWCVECSNGAPSGHRDVPLDPPDPPVCNELVDDGVVPVPAPREPASELLLGRNDRGANGGTDELAERTARVAGAGYGGRNLIPTREDARVSVRLLVDECAGDKGAAPLERMAKLSQLLRRQSELGL